MDKTLAPHQVRVFEEKAQLDERIGRLGAFKSALQFETLDKEEQDLLVLQLQVMHTYSIVLRKRIERF